MTPPNSSSDIALNSFLRIPETEKHLLLLQTFSKAPKEVPRYPEARGTDSDILEQDILPKSRDCIIKEYPRIFEPVKQLIRGFHRKSSRQIGQVRRIYMYCPHLLARLSLIVSTCLIKDVASPGGRRVAVGDSGVDG